MLCEGDLKRMLALSDASIVIVPVAVCARMAAAVAVGAMPLGAVMPLRARGALAIALAAVALPHASLAADAGPATLVILAEAVVGAGLGLVVAACCAAAAWAGGVVGSVSGLTWADDFATDGDPQAGGVARLAWWLGLAGFFAADGHLAVVAGLVDSFRSLPLGTPPSAVAARVAEAPDTALALALALAGPALVAVVTFHVAAAVCLRTVRFAPGQGVLQAAAALVALGIVLVGTPAWLEGFGVAARDGVERTLPATPPP
jgi:flagellar biosynthetic protein FliR